jgi:hypothetical protein
MFTMTQILKLEEVFLEDEVRIGSGYRIHTASYRNKAAIMKVFEGFSARQVRIACEPPAALSQRLVRFSVDAATRN